MNVADFQWVCGALSNSVGPSVNIDCSQSVREASVNLEGFSRSVALSESAGHFVTLTGS